MNRENRYSRQSSLVPEDRLKDLTITIAGTGAIGRNVALQLSSIGAQNLTLIDFDKVEESNIASQGFLEEEIGLMKTTAVVRGCLKINNDINIDAYDTRFKKSHPVTDVLFCCVDKMKSRSFIFDAVQKENKLFIDGRMAAESLQVYTSYSPMTQTSYKESLFSDEEAYQATCTAKSTIYCANIAAGMMVSQFTKWLRDFPLNTYVSFDIFSNEMETRD
ncbi:MAG: ThiF family adenylyltransferase [Bacteroidetes bacterium]|nr:MAG: ThiF family adenylyltransferase [Bacteroidota bacterium]